MRFPVAQVDVDVTSDILHGLLNSRWVERYILTFKHKQHDHASYDSELLNTQKNAYVSNPL